MLFKMSNNSHSNRWYRCWMVAGLAALVMNAGVLVWAWTYDSPSISSDASSVSKKPLRVIENTTTFYEFDRKDAIAFGFQQTVVSMRYVIAAAAALIALAGKLILSNLQVPAVTGSPEPIRGFPLFFFWLSLLMAVSSVFGGFAAHQYYLDFPWKKEFDPSRTELVVLFLYQQLAFALSFAALCVGFILAYLPKLK